MPYMHGIYIRETPTSVVAPVTSDSAVQVVIDTAPINLGEVSTALEPKLAYNYAEAVAKIGYSDDVATFGLMQSLKASFESYNVGPVVFINVMDPTKHTKKITDEATAAFNGKAVVAHEGIMLAGVTVKIAEPAKTLVEGTDYTLSHNSKGQLEIIAITGGAFTAAITEVKVSCNQLDSSKVTEQDIIAGIKKVALVYPKFNLVPGLIISPNWSHKVEVYNAMTAVTEKLNGLFSCVALCDIDTATAATYDVVGQQKSKDGMTSKNSVVCWPKCRVGKDIYSMSAVLGALTASEDSKNGGVPYVSPSNKQFKISGICTADGKEVVLDLEQANSLNGQGVCTAINLNGWRFWGNRTACYPAITDVKDAYIPLRRMFNWWGNSFTLTYFQKVDDPMNRRLIESVVDSENIRAGGFKSRMQIADAYIEYRLEDNPESELLNGVIHFKQHLTPFLPAEAIISDLEFDPKALTSALS